MALNRSVNNCLNANQKGQKGSWLVLIFKGYTCIIVHFEVNCNLARRVSMCVKRLFSKREMGTLTGVKVAIMFDHAAVGVWEEAPQRISMLTSGCHKSFCWWFVTLELLVLLEREKLKEWWGVLSHARHTESSSRWGFVQTFWTQIRCPWLNCYVQYSCRSYLYHMIQDLVMENNSSSSAVKGTFKCFCRF